VEKIKLFKGTMLQRQQEVMGRIVIGSALSIQQELGAAIATLSAANHWNSDVPPTAKGQPRAQAKVTEKYEGDWMGIKDMSRVTIVIENRSLVETVLTKVKNYFNPGNGWGYVETKYPKGDDDPCGYSDWKIIVTRKGYKAEIQINTKAMIYAKSMSSFKKVCPNDWEKMKTKYALPGGLGHQLFVIWRQNKAANGHIAKISTRYYDYFRSDHVLGEVQVLALKYELMELNLKMASH
jgi:hypothetical protein